MTRKMTKPRQSLLLTALVLAPMSVVAQEADPAPAPESPEAPPENAGTPTPDAPGASAPAGGAIYVPPFGVPPPGADLNPNLPSSSKPSSDTGSFSDGFDLRRGTDGSQVVRGREGAAAILPDEAPSRPLAPEVHTVRRGDTLWALSDQYYGNPWQWPRLWSYNAHVENPHWIYPGDQLRMRSGAMPSDGRGATDQRMPAGAAFLGRGGGGDGAGGRRGPSTIVLRDQGFMADPQRDNWGELVGSREDQMLLSEGNTVYLQLRDGAEPKPGQLLTLFALSEPRVVAGARKPPGQIVSVKGTVKVDSYDSKKHIARGRIVESLDIIERGVRVGPVGRRFVMVDPKTSRSDVKAKVLNAIYPHVYLAQDQILFLDRGKKDGLEPGVRLVIVRRGDTWRQSVRAGASMTRDRIDLNSPEPADSEHTPLSGDEQDFPEEIVGQVRVLKTQEYSAIAVVTRSSKEIVPGDVAVARRGY